LAEVQAAMDYWATTTAPGKVVLTIA